MLNYAHFRASFFSILHYFASKISKNTEKSRYCHYANELEGFNWAKKKEPFLSANQLAILRRYSITSNCHQELTYHRKRSSWKEEERAYGKAKVIATIMSFLVFAPQQMEPGFLDGTFLGRFISGKVLVLGRAGPWPTMLGPGFFLEE